MSFRGVGYSGLLGVGLPSALSSRAQAAEAGRTIELLPHKPKQVLIVFLTGAASYHDTFDMKSDAPAEVRGEFNPIATSIPGLHGNQGSFPDRHWCDGLSSTRHPAQCRSPRPLQSPRAVEARRSDLAVVYGCRGLRASKLVQCSQRELQRYLSTLESLNGSQPCDRTH